MYVRSRRLPPISALKEIGSTVSSPASTIAGGSSTTTLAVACSRRILNRAWISAGGALERTVSAAPHEAATTAKPPSSNTSRMGGASMGSVAARQSVRAETRSRRPSRMMTGASRLAASADVVRGATWTSRVRSESPGSTDPGPPPSAVRSTASTALSPSSLLSATILSGGRAKATGVALGRRSARRGCDPPGRRRRADRRAGRGEEWNADMRE